MNISILQKFFGKFVDLYVNGTAHQGILEDLPNEGVVLLKPKETNEIWIKNYGEMYIATSSIDSVRECLEPKPVTLEPIDREEESEKIRREQLEEVASKYWEKEGLKSLNLATEEGRAQARKILMDKYGLDCKQWTSK